MKNKFHTYLLGGMFALSFGALPSQAATFTWDSLTGAGNDGVQDGSGTWLPSSTNFWNGTANGTPTKGTDNIVIGGTPGTGDHTIIINNGGAMLNYADGTSASTLTFNQSYTLAGNTAADGLSIGNITVQGGANVTISARLDGGTGPSTAIPTRSWAVNGSTLNLSGGGRLQNISNNSATASTVNITGGTWAIGGTNASGQNQAITLGGGGTPTEARILTINQTAGTITADNNLTLGRNPGDAANPGTRTTYNLSGGAMNFTGGALGIGGATAGGTAALATFNVNGGTLTSTGAEIRVGNDGGSGALNVSSGTVSSTGRISITRGGNTGGAVSGTVSISGGVVTVGGMDFGRSGQPYVAGSTATLNLSGGTLYIANNGVNTGLVNSGAANLQSAINLSGGILGAGGNWSTLMTMTLSNQDGGVTIQTANAASAAQNVTLNGLLQGTGGFTKTGAGSLTLNGSVSNTYSGGTVISAGNLIAATAGSLGSGNMTVNGGSLTLQNANTIADTAILYFNDNAVINLDFAGVDTLAGITHTTTSQSIGAGLHTADDLNQFFGANYFTGTGSLNVIPEPSAWLLAISGLGAACLVRRRQVV